MRHMNNENYLENENVFSFDSDGNNSMNSKTICDLVSLELKEGEKVIRYYDANTGFHTIKNPGWIIFDLRERKRISYIRFLLWDNCGSEKKQPSRRKYLYRLLVADEMSKEGMGASVLRWEVVYDTMFNGSNGWQEFYFESTCKYIRYIKIYFMNNSRDQYTHLVNIQAYEYPTQVLYNCSQGFGQTSQKKQGVYKWFNHLRGDSGKVENQEMAPPIHGLINNRVIIGKQSDETVCSISLRVYERVVRMLVDLNDNIFNTELENIKSEITERLKELHTIDKELQYFQNSIYNPVIRRFSHQQCWSKWLARFTTGALIITIIQWIVDTCSAFAWHEEIILFIRKLITFIYPYLFV